MHVSVGAPLLVDSVVVIVVSIVGSTVVSFATTAFVVVVVFTTAPMVVFATTAVAVAVVLSPVVFCISAPVVVFSSGAAVVESKARAVLFLIGGDAGTPVVLLVVVFTCIPVGLSPPASSRMSPSVMLEVARPVVKPALVRRTVVPRLA
jgi:hypothetical protein